MTSERIKFLFDSRHAVGASHHLKLAVIDDYIAFIGGLDISSAHWDERDHRAFNPGRSDPVAPLYEPYHDVQAYFTGPDVLELSEMFRERWICAGGEDFEPGPPVPHRVSFKNAIPVRAPEFAISRTRARNAIPPMEPVSEIRELYKEAILAAERAIYIENQYFTSRHVFDSLVARMEDGTKGRLNIIIVLPKRFNAFLEELMLALAQVKLLKELREAARRTGHALGVYYAASPSNGGPEVQTYVHSKVLAVDDVFLTVGSANTSNRSMSLDTELNASWEAREGDGALADSIRDARAALIAEHLGVGGRRWMDRLGREREIVALLDTLADTPPYRLHRHMSNTFYEDVKLIRKLAPEGLSFDPDAPLIGEDIYESIFVDERRGFADEKEKFGKWLAEKLGTPPPARARRPSAREQLLRDVRRFRRRKVTLAMLLAALAGTIIWVLARGC